jgi:hypothetical protein
MKKNIKLPKRVAKVLLLYIKHGIHLVSLHIKEARLGYSMMTQEVYSLSHLLWVLLN